MGLKLQGEYAIYPDLKDCKGVCFLYALLFKHLMSAGFVAFALGGQHSMILKQDGSVWSTGISLRGSGPSAGSSKFLVQVLPSGATAIAAGYFHSIALKEDGGVWAMGRNAKGQLGDGTAVGKAKFFFVQMIPGAKAVAAGGHHSMVLTQAGQVWATGWNQYGQLGHGATSTTRFRLAISNGAKAVAAGDVHSILLLKDGSLWAAGRNDHGQIGDGSKTNRKSFVKVMTTSSGVADVAAGGYHSLVLKQDGSVWATGWNEYGQLGDGSTSDRTKYIEVVSSEAEVKTVAAGSRHSMMIQQDGGVWTAGYNAYGQLGDGTTTNSKYFVQVMSDGATAAAAGAYHSMAIKQGGTVWATGSNRYGQFGDGTTTSKRTFFRLAIFGDGWQHDNIRMQLLLITLCILCRTPSSSVWLLSFPCSRTN